MKGQEKCNLCYTAHSRRRGGLRAQSEHYDRESMSLTWKCIRAEAVYIVTTWKDNTDLHFFIVPQSYAVIDTVE